MPLCVALPTLKKPHASTEADHSSIERPQAADLVGLLPERNFRRFAGSAVQSVGMSHCIAGQKWPHCKHNSRSFCKPVLPRDQCTAIGLWPVGPTYALNRLMTKRSKAKSESSPVAKKLKMANGSATKANGRPVKLQDIDEDLHSRQLAVYGRGAMRRMAESNILICGLGGLGVETGAVCSLQSSAANFWLRSAVLDASFAAASQSS